MILEPKYKPALINKLSLLREKYFVDNEWIDIGFGNINPIIAIKIDNGSAILLDNKAYFINNGDSLVNLISQIFIKFVDKGSWFKNEMKRPQEERSIISRYIYSSILVIKENLHDSISIKAISDLEILFRLYYDIFILINHGKLPGKFRKRLLNPDQNSKAFRNELRLATIFIEAGFNIEWKKNKNIGEKIVEFDAIDLNRNHVFSVESKRLDKPDYKSINNKIHDAVHNAIDKSPENPYFIFLDLNMKAIDFERFIIDNSKNDSNIFSSIRDLSVFLIITNLENNYAENWTNEYPSFHYDFQNFIINKEYFYSLDRIHKRLRRYPKIDNLEKSIYEIY